MIEKFQKQLQLGSWLLVVVVALAGLWLAQGVKQMVRGDDVVETVTVSGTGTVDAAPDVAVAELAISVEAATAAAAQTDANRKSEAVVAYLKRADIDEQDIRTSNYSISPQYDYLEGRTRIRGYQVNQSLTVKIRDLEKANQVLDGVVDAGVNQVNNFRFEVDEPEDLQEEARQKAIEQAHEKADRLRDQLGIRLGKVVGFQESNGGWTPPVFMKSYDSRAMAGEAGIVANPAPELPAGQNEISVTVTITYQIR